MSILHTVVPLDVVLGPDGPAGAGQAHPAGVSGPVQAAAFHTLGPGRWLEVAGGCVRRLHSSDPRDYLDGRYQPGVPFGG